MRTRTWQFASRFRRYALGWRSDTPDLADQESACGDQTDRTPGARTCRWGCRETVG